MTSKRNKKGHAQPRFKVGDRVTEQNRINNIWLSDSGKKTFKVFKDRKVGVVEEVFTKSVKGGANYFYVRVAWENSNHKSVHSQMRLIPVS
jgi:hypothetical protein